MSIQYNLAANAGQITEPVAIMSNTKVTATNGYIQWAPNTLADYKNNIVNWQVWPLGAAPGNAISLNQMIIRLVGTSDGATAVVDQGNKGQASYGSTPNTSYWLVNGIAYDQSGVQSPPQSGRIANQQKIQRMLSKLARASYERQSIAIHGMSIYFGVGSNNTTTYTGGGVGRTRSLGPITSQMLNRTLGGTFSPGFDAVISGVWAVTAPATFSTTFASAGVEGRVISPSTGSADYTITGGYAGQVVRIYSYAVPTGTPSDPVTARYSISGANTVPLTNATPSTGAPIIPLGTGHWYEFNITLANAGNSVISVQNPAAGGTIVIYGADYDYLTSAGITMHRLCRSGTGITDTCAWALDATDTQPAGNWVAAGTTGSNRRDNQFESMTSRLGIVGAICSFDVNDIVKSTTYGYTLADHYRHVKNYANRMNAAGYPVLFVCGFLRDPSTIASSQTQKQIIDVYKRVSDESDVTVGCAFLDMSAKFIGTEQERYNQQWADLQIQVSGEIPPLHPNDQGHAKYGYMNYSALIEAISNI